MATKSVSIFANGPSSNADGSPMTDCIKSATVSPAHVARLLETIESRDQRFSSVDGPEIGGYRIGLTPADNVYDRSGSATPVLKSLDSVVVLPYTWNELMMRVCNRLRKVACLVVL